MILKVKYFGMIAESVSKQEELLDIEECTLNNLDAVLKSKYSKISSLNYRFAVNQLLVEDNINLCENDEVAILPPFAGG